MPPDVPVKWRCTRLRFTFTPFRSESKVSLSLSLARKGQTTSREREREVVRGMMEEEREREGVWFATLETLVKYSRKRVRNFFRSFSFLPRCPRLGIPFFLHYSKIIKKHISFFLDIYSKRERKHTIYIHTHKGREKSKGRRYVIPPRPQHVRPSPVGGEERRKATPNEGTSKQTGAILKLEILHPRGDTLGRW